MPKMVKIRLRVWAGPIPRLFWWPLWATLFTARQHSLLC